MNIIIEDEEITTPFADLNVGSLFKLRDNEIYLKIERIYTNFNAVNLSESRLANFSPDTKTIEYEGFLSVKRRDFEK